MSIETAKVPVVIPYGTSCISLVSSCLYKKVKRDVIMIFKKKFKMG